MPYKNGRAYDGDGYTPGPGRPQKQPVDELREQWLATHPCGALAFHYYVTGIEPSAQKAATRAIREIPGESKPASLMDIAKRHRWSLVREAVQRYAQQTANFAALEGMKRVEDMIRFYQEAVRKLKPDNPANPNQRLEFLVKLRDAIQAELLSNPGGTQAVNSYKLLGMVEKDIDSLTNTTVHPDDEDDGGEIDYDALHAGGTLEPKQVPAAPHEMITGPLAEQIQAQIDEQQRQWRSEGTVTIHQSVSLDDE